MNLIEEFKNSSKFWLILAILLVFPLGQLTRIEAFLPEIHFYWHDFLIIILLASLILQVIPTLLGGGRKGLFCNSKIFKLILSFGIFGLFSLGLNSYRFSFSQIIISSLYLWRFLAYSSIFFVVKQLLPKQRNKVNEYLIFAGVTLSIFGLVQYFFFPSARDLMADGWDPHLFRVIGTFLDPGFTGLIYVLTMILLINSTWNRFCHPGGSILIEPVESHSGSKLMKGILSVVSTPSRMTKATLLVICYSAFSLTYARSAYLAFLVGMWVFAYFKKSFKVGLLATLLLALTIFLLPRTAGEGVKLERQNSVYSRFASWENAIKIFKEAPIFGSGFNTYRYVQKERGLLGGRWQESHAGAGADSSLLLVLATTGTTGLIVFLILLIEIFKKGIQNLDYSLLASLTAVFIHSFFNNSLFYPWVMIWLWILIGL